MVVRWTIAAFLFGACAAAPPKPTASKPPAGLRAGDTWRVTVRGAHAAARFQIRYGSERRSFAIRRASATVVFPHGGRWSYGIHGRSLFVRLGVVSVLPRRLVLLEPFDVVELGPWYFIADRSANAVYRISAATGDAVRIASLPHARDLDVVDGSTLLVASDQSVFRLNAVTGATERVALAEAGILGLAHDAAGNLYVSELGEHVVRIAPDGSRRVVVSGREGIHGLSFQNASLLACETGAGNVLSIDLDTRAVEIVARGLGNPSNAVATAEGIYVTEFTNGRISLLANGGSRAVAQLPQAGSLFRARDGTLLSATLEDVVRVDPRTGRVRPLLR